LNFTKAASAGRTPAGRGGFCERSFVCHCFTLPRYV
jgi:hypothetical protein